MSRSGYTDDCDNLELYRASVDRALQGKRGQAFLRELAEALDAMPEKVLISGELINEQGACCAIGAVCKSRSLDVSKIDYDDPDRVALAVGVARSMAAEIAYVNDEGGPRIQEEPAKRWERVRKWVSEQIKTPQTGQTIT